MERKKKDSKSFYLKSLSFQALLKRFKKAFEWHSIKKYADEEFDYNIIEAILFR